MASKPIHLTGSTVLNTDGHFEKAMRKFKKKIQNSGLMDDLRDRECYVKPSIRKKLKKAAAKSRWKRKLRSESLPAKLY